MDLTKATWRKSTYSGGNEGNCVEVANLPGTVVIRDSKNPNGLTLTFTSAEWRTFLTTIKNASA